MDNDFDPHDEEKSLFTPAQVNWVLNHFDPEKHPDLKDIAEKVNTKIKSSYGIND